jgi:ubiquinol-cytochrome c reductase iron-sulfur subunit
MTSARPTEPTEPSPHGARFRAGWIASWLAGATFGLVVLAILWFTGARVEVLATAGALVALAVAVALHHLVVTQDAGEHSAERRPSGAAVPGTEIPRRHLLGGIVAGVVALLAGLIGLQRFGPRMPRGSAWSAGQPLVTITGTRLRPEDVPLGGVVTVWPEAAVGTERAAVMVIRLREPPEAPTQLDGVADDRLVAYSRLCTHAGCAVALYRDRDQALFCPCHQATFDARRGATPTGGPASLPLPQLPIEVAADGHLVASDDLSQDPGPVGGRA